MNPLHKSIGWYVRYGISTAFELWWRCDIPLLVALSVEWDVARMDLEPERTRQ